MKLQLAPLAGRAAPSGNTVHLWPIVRPDSTSEFAELLPHLSQEEIERGERYRSLACRYEFYFYRRALRRCLASYAGVLPKEIPLHSTSLGKPLWSEPVGGVQLAFSLSHKTTRALIAVSRLECVGVDLEQADERTHWTALYREALSASEHQELLGVPEQHRVAAFLKAWTCKEAFLKAVGCGMSRPLPSVEIKCFSTPYPKIVQTGCSTESADAWQLASWSPWPHGWAAVAAPSHGEPLRIETVHGLQGQADLPDAVPD